MSIQGQNNYSYQFRNGVPFQSTVSNPGAVITKPIDKVEAIVNNTVDVFVPSENKSEETKKSHKTAIRVGSTVIVLSALVALLNPKFSSKLIEKMKSASAKYGNKAQENSFTGKIYQGLGSFFSKGAKILSFINNFNPFKDQLFKKLCSKVGFLNKTHVYITNLFDKLAKQTVYKSYRDLEKVKQPYDKILERYISRLPQSERSKAERILESIKSQNNYFSPSEIASRLQKQEDVMANLESDTVKKMKEYASGFKGVRNAFKDKTYFDRTTRHVKDNMYFWAEDIIMPERNKVESEGMKVVHTLVGDGNAKTGKYQELLEIIYPHIKKEERVLLDDGLKITSSKLNKAASTECVKYFDKKRDLILGSAPTDVLTPIVGLGLSGLAIGAADSKEERISRLNTVVFPAIAGLGVSLGMTALLYSGIKGMMIGAASSGILSMAGNGLNKLILPKQNNGYDTRKGEVHYA